MAKYRYERVLSDDLRHGTAQQRAGLLEWVNQPKFNDRKPTPEELTKECRRKTSPMYGLLKVDQKAAAEAYWRQTAQDIIRHIDVVRVEIKTGKAVSKPVRAWVPISIEKGGRIPEENYVPTQRAIQGKRTRATILDRARREFEAWMDRWERYDEFAREFSPVLEAYRAIRDDA
jgi:hypothetical protein